MKILAIGNSFSEDAIFFLHDILSAADIDNKVVNLYIGGCPLERHWQNIENNSRAYQYNLNGHITDRRVTIQEALAEEEWDAIITHQASHDSGWEDTYEPFLGLLKDYFHTQCPKAKLYLNETWAYEQDSPHANFMRYHRDQAEMFTRLDHAYHHMAEKYGLTLIPSGRMIQALRSTPYFRFEDGRYRITRDGFHMSFLYGRFAVAAMWANVLCNVNMKDNPFVPEVPFFPEMHAEAAVLQAIRDAADHTLYE